MEQIWIFIALILFPIGMESCQYLKKEKVSAFSPIDAIKISKDIKKIVYYDACNQLDFFNPFSINDSCIIIFCGFGMDTLKLSWYGGKLEGLAYWDNVKVSLDLPLNVCRKLMINSYLLCNLDVPIVANTAPNAPLIMSEYYWINITTVIGGERNTVSEEIGYPEAKDSIGVRCFVGDTIYYYYSTPFEEIVNIVDKYEKISIRWNVGDRYNRGSLGQLYFEDFYIRDTSKSVTATPVPPLPITVYHWEPHLPPNS